MMRNKVAIEHCQHDEIVDWENYSIVVIDPHVFEVDGVKYALVQFNYRTSLFPHGTSVIRTTTKTKKRFPLKNPFGVGWCYKIQTPDGCFMSQFILADTTKNDLVYIEDEIVRVVEKNCDNEGNVLVETDEGLQQYAPTQIVMLCNKEQVKRLLQRRTSTIYRMSIPAA